MISVGSVIFPNVPIPVSIIGGTPWWIQSILAPIIVAVIAGGIGYFTAILQDRRVSKKISEQRNSERNSQLSLLFTEIYILLEQIKTNHFAEKTDVLYARFDELATWNLLRPLLPAFMNHLSGTQEDVNFIKIVNKLQETATQMNGIIDVMRQASVAGNTELYQKSYEALYNLLKLEILWSENAKVAQKYIRKQIGQDFEDENPQSED